MKIRRLPFTVLALLSLPLLISSLQGQDTSKGKSNNGVSGRTGSVYSASSKEKIPQVRIIFTSEDQKIRKEVVSNENGIYRVELPTGRYKISADHEGYGNYTIGKGFVVVKENDLSTFNISMIKAGEAEKTIAATKNTPASGIEIIEQNSQPQVGFLIEYFKLDHRTANKLIRKYTPKAANAGELRGTLGDMVKKGDAELIETGWLRGLSGQRIKTESVEENIYPTDYYPPQINSGNALVYRKSDDEQSLAEQRARKVMENSNRPDPQIQISAAIPTAFETRSAGLTLEVDSVVSSNSAMIDLSLSPEIVTRLEDAHFTRPGFEHTAYGIDNISMPTFYMEKTTLQIKAIPGNYNLLGLHTPYNDPDKRILVLLKADLFLAK